jgi:prepilin-type N-terminal cleavage/methylation domain-containing protein
MESRRGLTLIELLMVMGLVGLVLGIGLGAIANVDPARHAAVGMVQSALRASNQWAIARRAPARVRIDAAAGVLHAEGQDVIGTWHFEEDPPRGAFELDGRLEGARLVEDGFLGRALSLAGCPPGARFEVGVDKSPAYDLRAGFRLQMVLRPEGNEGGSLLKVGDAIGLDVARDNGLTTWFSAWRKDELGQRVAAGKVRLETPPRVLRAGRWNRVLLSYDRGLLAIEVEGLRVAELAEDAEVGPVRSPLEVGGGQRPWPGAIDSLVITAVSAEERVELPRGVAIVPGGPREVLFAPGGGLDRSVHAEPVVIELDFLDGARKRVQVNLYGTVE